MKNNLFSVICIQSDERSGTVSLELAKVFSEKIKKKAVYIPVGTIFDYSGEISLTDLYFDFLKNRDYRIGRTGLTIVKPFNCFLEAEEISDEEYFRFIMGFSKLFDIAIINLVGTSPGKMKYFIENSMVTAVLISCTQKDYSERYKSFLRNLKLAWGERSEIYMQNFIYILQGGNLKDISVINQITVSVMGISKEFLNGKIFEAEYLDAKINRSIFKFILPQWR